ncbi:hypothetical protein ACQ4PT_037813 [Festuca glaucescens]
MDVDDVFSLPNGATTDIAGVIMYVSPLDHETYFPVGMREVAVVDSSNHIVFLRIFDELVERHGEQLLIGERHYSFVMATSMEVDKASSVRERIYNDLYSGEAVKNVVLLRRDAQKPANEYNAVQLPAQASSIKHIFNHLTQSTPHTAPAQVNKFDEVD